MLTNQSNSWRPGHSVWHGFVKNARGMPHCTVESNLTACASGLLSTGTILGVPGAANRPDGIGWPSFFGDNFALCLIVMPSAVQTRLDASPA